MIEQLDIRDENGKQVLTINKSHLIALRDMLLEQYPDVEVMKLIDDMAVDISKKEKIITTLKSDNKKLRKEINQSQIDAFIESRTEK